jgi:hypothetical protein
MRADLYRLLTYVLLAAFMSASVLKAAPVGADEMTEEAVLTEGAVCKEAPAAQSFGETISGAASAEADILDMLGDSFPAVPEWGVGPALPPYSIYERAIMSYQEGQNLTATFGGKIQAHHILETRHIEAWGKQAGMTAAQIEKAVAEAPSVVLTRNEHILANKMLDSKLACGKVWDQQSVWHEYQDAYKLFPHWLEAIASYFL